MIIHSKIVGMKVAMPDPVRREEIVRDCKKGEVLILERMPNDPHDKNAVAVMRVTREKLGYVESEAAAKIVPEMDKNQTQYEGVIEKVTGGAPGFFASLFGGKETPLGFDIVITKKY